MAVLEQSVLSVADYLRNKNLRIPPFQRPYKWSVTNVLQLLDELRRGIFQYIRESYEML